VQRNPSNAPKQRQLLLISVDYTHTIRLPAPKHEQREMTMVLTIRRKSPRAPSMPLAESLDRAMRVYDQERLHPAPIEAVASAMGYKSANNGSALAAIASLRYYGLLERPKDGFLAVTKNVELFKYTPSESQKDALMMEFLRAPPLYGELLDQYASGLPSDATLLYELIQKGYQPGAAEGVLSCFKQSVQFAGYFEKLARFEVSEEVVDVQEQESNASPPQSSQVPMSQVPTVASVSINAAEDEGLDRYPVRLPGARKAWLLIPEVFYEADKSRLIAQINLLLTEEEK
jgi:hypothetical protein